MAHSQEADRADFPPERAQVVRGAFQRQQQRRRRQDEEGRRQGVRRPRLHERVHRRDPPR